MLKRWEVKGNYKTRDAYELRKKRKVVVKGRR